MSRRNSKRQHQLPARKPLPPQVRKMITRPAPRKAQPTPRTGFRG